MSTAAAFAALEAENRRLREALVFAERGWRDALSFVGGQSGATQNSKPEDILEIKSLQHEINMLQRQIMKRAQMADEFQNALTFSAEELEQTTNQLMVQLHAEVPIGKTHYAPPLWTLDFPSDSEVASSTQLTHLGRLLRKLKAIVEWVKENSLEKFPHYEGLMSELNPNSKPQQELFEDTANKSEDKKIKKKKKKTTTNEDAASVKSKGSKTSGVGGKVKRNATKK
jgi:hypothetical protein